MWPFKKKQKQTPKALPSADVLSPCDGVVDSIMFDHVTVNGKQVHCRKILVEHGQRVVKNQLIGKK